MLYSTGEYIQYFVITYTIMEKNLKIYIFIFMSNRCITESLCYTSVTLHFNKIINIFLKKISQSAPFLTHSIMYIPASSPIFLLFDYS